MKNDKTLARKKGATDTPPRRRKPVRVSADSDGKITIQSTPEEVANSLLGEGGDPAAANVLLQKLGKLIGLSEGEVNGTLALIVGLEPQNTAEAIIALQVVATSNLSLRLHTEAANFPGTRNYINVARTALTASRTTCELLGRLDAGRRPAASTQKIIVERVDGAQVAIGCTAPEQGEGGA